MCTSTVSSNFATAVFLTKAIASAGSYRVALKEAISKEDAEKLVAELKEAGAEAEIK